MIDNRNVLVFILALIILGGLIIAKPDFLPSNAANATKTVVEVGPSQGKAIVTIPSHAVEVSPGVFFLGTELKDGKLLEGYAYVDYREGFGKPTGCNYDGKCQGWEDSTCGDCVGSGTSDSTCYGFLAKGAKWKVTESFLINPTNTRGLSESEVVSLFDSSIDKWEDAAGVQIVGTGSQTSANLSADMSSTDGKNEVYFGSISDRNAIAITVVWGIFRGPPKQRELVEWDMIFDQEDFDWSTSGEATAMDFESLATHELGHTVGLGDLYESSCSEETMYGYASNGETKKRTLEAGDIKGVQELYS
jgi:hypothetical protein